jgi:MFS family permease
LVVNFPAGYASERFGRRCMMGLGCLLVAGASFSVLATSYIGAFFACLLVMGMASSTFVTSALAAVADLGTPGRRVQDMSLYQGANMIGTSMGPALGGLVAGHWGLSAPFLANGTVAVIGFLVIAAMPWYDTKDLGQPVKSTRAGLMALAKESIGIGLMCFSLFYVRIASLWILMPLIAQTRFQMDLTAIGLILTCGAIANLTILPFNAVLAARLGRIRMIVLSSAFALLACTLLAFGDHSGFFWVSSILFGVASGIGTPTLTAYVADVAPADQRGPAMGLLRTAQDLSMILGPFVTGLLSDHLGLGFQGGLLGCLVLLFVATGVFCWRARRQ